MNILAIRTFQRLAASSCAFILLFAAAGAQAEERPTLTTHVPEAVARGVAPLVGYLPSTQRLSLAISLPLRNEADLDELLEQLYDPQSPSFHHYLSVQDFTSRFGPTESDYAAVLRFAENNGLAVIDTAANHMVLDVEGSAANIENAFHVSMNVYQHPTEARTFYAPDREPTPDLDVPLLHISGLDNFTLPRAKNVRSSGDNTQAQDAGKATGSGPGGQFIGSDMRAAYYGGTLKGAGQSVGLFEFAGYEISDVNLYFKNVKQTLKVPVKGVSLNGVSLNCPPSSCDDSEQVLDIEMAISMAPALKQVIVYVGSSDVSIFNRMAADNTSKQLSCSWGWSDDETSLDPIFKEMAMQGQTVFVATGDNGSSTPADVVWPADDPYITAVGGTDLTTTGPGGAWKSETGWNGSAGMPSKNKVPIPSYQKLAGVIDPLNRGSKNYRNIPDVAAEANTNQYSCYDGGCSGGNGGTSYAAPQWAGLTAMANQQSIAGGGKALGFLNPAIYDIGVGTSYHKDFHDITSGSNGRYSAVTGYDLVTGWGSPDGPNLIDALVASGKSE
ncbi:MAG: protease pro-enzyme activation domain-containing protein [Candidatus Sulfotelmatobacter sp.]